LRRILLLALFAGLSIVGWMSWRSTLSRRRSAQTSQPTIVKQPVNLATRTFDASALPAEMPPLTPGENAECDSNFLSSANVFSETERRDATHATLTITQIKMTLQLNVTIWVPAGVSQHVMEHEEGHRQISEYYYQAADKIAERIAAAYIGRQVDITGPNLAAESDEALHKMAVDITDQYNRELNPAPTQLLYDAITDHSRNGVAAKDAVIHALKNVTMESGGIGEVG
jgi:hypothetical protein